MKSILISSIILLFLCSLASSNNLKFLSELEEISKNSRSNSLNTENALASEYNKIKLDLLKIIEEEKIKIGEKQKIETEDFLKGEFSWVRTVSKKDDEETSDINKTNEELVTSKG